MGNSQLRVLLVDDDEGSYLITRHLLCKVPNKTFDLRWVSTFDDGFKAMMKGEYDVCLLDYNLGPDTGLDLLRKAVSEGVRKPVIMLTGNGDPRLGAEAALNGASDFLKKDQVTPILLEHSIRYALQQFAILNALQKSQDRLRLSFDKSRDAIVVTDEQGRFVEFNSAACALAGMSRKQLEQTLWSELFGAATDERGEPSVNVIELTRPDGQKRVVEFSGNPLPPDLHLSILRDITEERRLERDIQQISEREQRRLGQDLHDGLGQTLTGIAFLAKALEQTLQSKKIPESAQAGEISRLLNESLQRTRRISNGLCPVILEDNDIEAALLQLASDLQTYFGVACVVSVEPGIKITNNDVAVNLYRIAQEATTNAIKHGRAKKIEIDLSIEKCRLILRICDNGIGFSKVNKNTRGMGLRVMQHRAHAIGGSVNVQHPQKGGTIIVCTLKISNHVLKRSKIIANF